MSDLVGNPEDRFSRVTAQITDALAKEAATVSRDQPDCRRSTSIQEVKDAIMKTQLSKWQSRWDNTDYGRAYHMLVPKVDTKKFLDIPNRKSFCQILQIQTGFYKLNDYRHKLDLCDRIECICLPHSLSQLCTIQRIYAAEVIIPARRSYRTQQ